MKGTMKLTPHLKKLRWYWNRFQLMSGSEIVYRIRTFARTQIERWGYLTANKVESPNLSRTSKSWLNEFPIVEISHYSKAADALLEGQLNIFSLQNTNIGSILQWNHDPLTGKKAPLSFGKTLNCSDPQLVGDIKYLWELNRHLQFVTMAQAYRLSGDRQYLTSILHLLNTWFDQCPYLMGVNWSSSLELAIRLINWSFVWHLIGGVDCPAFTHNTFVLNRWLTSIYQHAHFISGHLSRFSSANNHLIGEAAGLFVAATTWPYWRVSSEWQEKAKKILIREALLQNNSDGVNREQAVSYQQFVLDFLLISALVGSANDIHFPKNYWDRIEAMLEYIAAVMSVSGTVPMIGDSDDGYVVRLSQEEEFCPYKSLLATGAILFNRGDFKAKAGELDHKTRWLLGRQAEQKYPTIKTKNPALSMHRGFNESGYYIAGYNFETPTEIRLVIDAGPIGYQSIAAHGHADALAFTLSLAGREFLIDPGTYSYHGKDEWRDYFRGTSAHNTVRVDGQDQSVSGASFMWLQRANAFCEVWQPGGNVDRFVGRHDGYTRLPDPLIHRREIILVKTECKLRVTDILQCRGSHIIERFWHFSEDCSVSLDGSTVLVQNGESYLRLYVIGSKYDISILHGEESPIGGWVSRNYDVKVPSTTIVYRTKIRGNTQLVTEMLINSL